MFKQYEPPSSAPPPGVPLDQTIGSIDYEGRRPPKHRRTRDEWTRMERFWDRLTPASRRVRPAAKWEVLGYAKDPAEGEASKKFQIGAGTGPHAS